MSHLSKNGIRLLVVFSLSGVSMPFAWADNPFLMQGIKDYYAGDYLNAAGHLGEAESADFSNPKLHYFLGNTFVHLKQREAAIREYRIAYALEPGGEVGNLSKNALALCGADKESSASDKGANVSPTAVTIPDDPLLKEALARLHESSNGIKQNAVGSAQAQAAGIGKLSDAQSELLKKQTQEAMDDVRHIRRIGGAMAEEERVESIAKQQNMQRFYDNQKYGAISAGRKRANAIDETVNNLEQLLNEPAKPGHVKLTPAGTNLYIRNYEHPPAEADQTQLQHGK